MIVGTGIDVVEIGRIQKSMDRYGQRFLNRVYTSAEQAYCLRKRKSAESFAARFAAKEAGAKALGTGIRYGVNWLEIEVAREAGGRPILQFHGRAAEIAALAKREGWFDAPIVAVQTDFQTEPPWVQPEIDMYCVASEDARGQLISWGVSPNRVLVCGIPVDPSFSMDIDKAELLAALGLDSRKPIVLVMGGGMGAAPLDAIVESLDLCSLPLQVLVVAGHNRDLKRALERLRRKVTLDLRIFGWTDKIPALMAAADVLVTKPGGLTIAEALSAGLPMIVTHPIPGPEERHVRYLVRHGVGVQAKTLAEIPLFLTQLLGKSKYLAAMSRRERDLSRPGAAHAVAQVGRALIEREGYIDLLASTPASSAESGYLM